MHENVLACVATYFGTAGGGCPVTDKLVAGVDEQHQQQLALSCLLALRRVLILQIMRARVWYTVGVTL
eukprot:363941-Chlamydomonas_euryale.AAC.7